MNSPSTLKTILASFINEAWNSGDALACDRYLAPQYTIYHDPGDPWAGQTLSIEGFKNRLRTSRAPFPDQKFEIVKLVGEESSVVMTWLWTGTHVGDIPGFPATNKVIKMSGATLYSFESDRICGHWQITDRLGVFQQLRGG